MTIPCARTALAPRATGRARRPVQRLGAWLAVAAVGMGTAACGRDVASVPRADAATTPARSAAEIRELDLQYFTARAERDPTGGSDLAHLGALYLARARETGDPRDVLLAERAARRSLRNRFERNSGAASVLQSSLLAQHRFAEALSLAKRARDAEPDNDNLRAAVGEIEMELGQYDSARVAFTGLHAAFGDLHVAPRLARWAEIEGHPDRARRLLAAALANARRESAMPAEQLAWYWLRVGDVELRTGHLRAADSAYRAGLAIHPDDYRLLSALTHSAAMQQQLPAAIALGERAIAGTLDPATLGVLSDAYAAIGDTAKSAEMAHVLDVAVLRQPGAYHRAWSLFLLDHRRHVALVSRKIDEELRTRQDIYAFDLLAWSLHVRGRDSAAAAAMTRAMQEHTEDAQLYFHAGMIARSLGRRDAARRDLERALAINPSFHPTQSAEARRALAESTMNAGPRTREGGR
jgi:tetratricopeptide (TPR) repeat protein